jgi:hypothetical protein
MPKPAVLYKFEAPRESLARTLMKTDGGEFLSAVAWKKVWKKGFRPSRFLTDCFSFPGLECTGSSQ